MLKNYVAPEIILHQSVVFENGYGSGSSGSGSGGSGSGSGSGEND